MLSEEVLREIESKNDDDGFQFLREVVHVPADVVRNFRKHGFTFDEVLLKVRKYDVKGLRTVLPKFNSFRIYFEEASLIRFDISMKDFAYAKILRDMECDEELIKAGVDARYLNDFEAITCFEDFKSNAQYDHYKPLDGRLQSLVDLRIENRLADDPIAENCIRQYYGLDTGTSRSAMELARGLYHHKHVTSEQVRKVGTKIEKAKYFLSLDHLDDREEMLNKLSDRLHRFVDGKIEASMPLGEDGTIDVIKSYIDHMAEILDLFPKKK